jgi:serine/threonine protein kinase
MGNAPAPAASGDGKQMQDTLNKDVQRVQTEYQATTSGEKEASEMYTRELKRDDPRTYYTFGDKLGEGAFGAVYKVIKKSNKRTYACKTINTNMSSCKQEMLHREIGTMLQCDHPHLINIQDVFQHGRNLHIIMDLVEMPGPGVCPDLFSWLVDSAGTGLGQKQATQQQVATIILKVAEALQYMNEKMGAIHRDLKPENVLVGPDGIDTLKVTDFGLARLGVDNEGGFTGTYQAGTEGYMAPEVIDPSNRDKDGKIFYGVEPFKVDVFSLGVLMFICFTKTPPYGLGPSAARSVLSNNIDKQALSRIRPVAARELVMGMLEPDQRLRLSIDQVLENDWLRTTAGC